MKIINKYQFGKLIISADALNVPRDEKDIKELIEKLKSLYATSNEKILNFVLPQIVVSAPYTGRNKEIEVLLNNPEALSKFTNRQKEFSGNINQAMTKAATTIAPAFIGLVNPLSFSASIAGGSLVDEASKLLGYLDWGDLASNSSTNPVTRTLLGFTNPGYLLGGLGAKQLNSYGRQVSSQHINLLLDLYNFRRSPASEFYKAIDETPVNTKKIQLKPKIRIKIGDVEINNPSLYYREGGDLMGDDFLNTGIVNRGTAFKNPMFSLGIPFYKYYKPTPLEENLKNPITLKKKLFNRSDFNRSKDLDAKTNLIVSGSETPMLPADNHSFPLKELTDISPRIYTDTDMEKFPELKWFMEEYNNAYYNGLIPKKSYGKLVNSGLRRIPAFQGAANLSNSILYRYDPLYGYRKVDTSSFILPFNLVVDENGNLMYPWLSLLKRLYKKYPDAKSMSSIINRGFKKHTNLAEHLSDVVKSALEYPIPEGVSRLDFVSAALYHDIGKILDPSSTHGKTSNKIIRELGVYTNSNIEKALASHMNNLEYFDDKGTILERMLHAADVGRGRPYLNLIDRFPYLDYTPKSLSKISFAERLGIPKGDRNNLSLNQKYALEDLNQYINSGLYRLVFRVTPDWENFGWDLDKNNPTFMQQFAADGEIMRGPWARVVLLTPTGKGMLAWNPDKNMGGYSSRLFSVPKGLKYAPGEANMMLDGSNLKIILTSPRVDIQDFMEDLAAGTTEDLNLFKLLDSQLKRTIDKNIIKDFWINARKVQRPGSYLSGDNGRAPLGSTLIEAFKKKLLHKTSIFERPLNELFVTRTGLSPDAYSSIIRLGNRDGSLRWGEGFHKWNPSAVKNKLIYEAFIKLQNGEITPEQYEQIFNSWSIGLGGRPLQWYTLGNKKIPVHPHPYIYAKKFGGKFNTLTNFI